MANCCFGKRPGHWPGGETTSQRRSSSFSGRTTSSDGQGTSATRTNSTASDEFQYLPEPLSHPEHDDYYAILGINRDADAEEVKRAYKAKALIWHPDKNIQCRHLAEKQFKLISEAYQVLNDPEKRREYDLHGEEGTSNNDQPKKEDATTSHHRHHHHHRSANNLIIHPANFGFATFSDASTFAFFHPGVPPVHYGQSYAAPTCCSGYYPGPSYCSEECPAANMFYSTDFQYNWQYPMTNPYHVSCPECDLGPSPKYRNKYRGEGNCHLNRSNIHYPSGRATEI